MNISIFVTLQVIEEQFVCFFHIFCSMENVSFQNSENWTFAPEEMLASVQEYLWLALALIAASSTEFRSGKLNFAALLL